MILPRTSRSRSTIRTWPSRGRCPSPPCPSATGRHRHSLPQQSRCSPEPGGKLPPGVIRLMGRTRPAQAEPAEPANGPLLSAAVRPVAVVIVAACAGTTALLGALLGHGAHADPVDTAVDSRVRAIFAGHLKLLELLARLGDLPAITGIT